MTNFDAGANSGVSSFDPAHYESDQQWMDTYNCVAEPSSGQTASQGFLDDRSSMLPSQSSSFAGIPLPGDYYRFEADTKRSIELPDNFFALNEYDVEGKGLCLAADTLPDNCQSVLPNEHIKFDVLPSTRFEHFEKPPNTPADLHFKLSATTFLCRCSPTECMNCLLDFFETEVISSVSKVSKKKFSVKVDILDKALMCSLKLRMYRQQTGELAVEFQKRSGDTIAFHEVYKKACLKLEQPSTRTEIFADMTPPSGQLKGPSSAGELSPLLDMLSLFDSPELQAEAAACLANIASGSQASAIVMCSVHLFDYLPKLLQIHRIDVAYPVACLLSSLADCTAAKSLFVDYGLVSAMEEQIQSVQKMPLVKMQLGAAVSAWCH